MKPSDETTARDEYKRQLHFLEFYLNGRVVQLGITAKRQPAEANGCEMAQSELRLLLDEVLPEMRRVSE